MTNPSIEVAVLGPIEISGSIQPFRRSTAKELVVYLSFHRGGVRNDQWAEALWPSRTVSASTVHSTVSDARRALGTSTLGHEHLPRRGRTVRLADTVHTDVEHFTRLASDDDLARWIEALELIRGPLFGGLNLSDWAVLDGTHAQVESLVVATALKAADSCLRRGLGGDAERMIRRALLVSPYDERLYRALLYAAEAQGNRGRLRSTMAQLLVLAAGAGEPFLPSGFGPPGRRGDAAVHPQTVALYRELTLGMAPAAGGCSARL